MAGYKKSQPLALTRALVVALKKCHEQDKLIKVLTQNTSQEEIIKSPENPSAQELSQHLLPPRSQWRSNISATIVANPGILLGNAVLLANLHFKYKVPTISVLDLMSSLEEILVGVIQTARRYDMKIDHVFTSFPPISSA